MLDDGLYDLDYKGKYLGEEDGSNALAILRNGKILGSDPWGGVFMGSYEYEPADGLNKVRLSLEVPPERMLITGFSAGPKGATVDIVGTFGGSAPSATTVVEVGGRPVEVKLTYLGPLPI